MALPDVIDNGSTFSDQPSTEVFSEDLATVSKSTSKEPADDGLQVDSIEEPSKQGRTLFEDAGEEKTAQVFGDQETASEEGTDEAAAKAVEDAAKTPETPKEEEKTPEQVEEEKQAHEKLSHRFALLAKTQKDLTRREQDIKEKEKKYANQERLEALKKEDLLAWLEENEVSYEEITDQVVKGGSSEVRKLNQKVSTLEKTLAAEKEREQKLKQEQERQEKVVAYKGQIRETISKELDKYPLINALGDYDTIYDLQVQEYDKSEGAKSLTPQQAAEVYEKHLVETLKKVPLSVIQKLHPDFGKTTASQKKPEEKHTAPDRVEKTTLTNDMSQSSSEAVDLDDLSSEESIERLAKKFNFFVE